MSKYVCPDCKTPLEHLYCKGCRFQYQSVGGIPILLSNDARFQTAREIVATYDSIYREQNNVWEIVGRTPEFIRYFSSLLGQFQSTRFLEIGCGEGFLLASLNAGEKFAVDLSAEAIKRAQTKTHADFSLALAERLPFPAESFDLIASVGVMDHFLEIDLAMREIRRVLKPGGHYVALTHVQLVWPERLAMRVSKYIYPKPKPIQLARRLVTRLKPPRTPDLPKQPIQNLYSTRRAEGLFRDNGFRVIEVLHTRKHPKLPLKGPEVVIYIGQKSAGQPSPTFRERQFATCASPGT
jgi:SAM-dependent methyltransferase